ncbi:MAG: hypothetical protein RL115_1648 [Bacteroidota bacterium]|jgi:hypothetical protein
MICKENNCGKSKHYKAYDVFPHKKYLPVKISVEKIYS